MKYAYRLKGGNDEFYKEHFKDEGEFNDIEEGDIDVDDLNLIKEMLMMNKKKGEKRVRTNLSHLTKEEKDERRKSLKKIENMTPEERQKKNEGKRKLADRKRKEKEVKEGGMMDFEDDLNDLSIFINEISDYLRLIQLPLTPPFRNGLLEIQTEIQDLLNVVEQGNSPFNDRIRRHQYADRLNQILRTIRSYLRFTNPQPIRPTNLPNPKPKRGSGMKGGMEDESDSDFTIFSDFDSELEKLRIYTQDADELTEIPIFSITREQLNEIRELKMIFEEYLNINLNPHQDTIIANLLNPVKSKIILYIGMYNNLQNFLTIVKNERRRATNIMRAYSVENLPDDDRDFLIEEQSNLEESISEIEEEENIIEFDREFILDFLRSYYNELISYLNTQKENIPPSNAGFPPRPRGSPFTEI